MATQIDNVFSVSSLNRSVKQLLEQNIGIIWLSAEVSNFIRAQSGHWYFTLKDHQAQVKSACAGDLDKLVRVVKLTGFVNSMPDFTQQPQVINGASDLMGKVLGDAGKHARVAVSANSLPLGVAVEIDGIFQIA